MIKQNNGQNHWNFRNIIPRLFQLGKRVRPQTRLCLVHADQTSSVSDILLSIKMEKGGAIERGHLSL